MQMRAHLTLQLGILSPLLFLMQRDCSSLATADIRRQQDHMSAIMTPFSGRSLMEVHLMMGFQQPLPVLLVLHMTTAVSCSHLTGSSEAVVPVGT